MKNCLQNRGMKPKKEAKRERHHDDVCEASEPGQLGSPQESPRRLRCLGDSAQWRRPELATQLLEGSGRAGRGGGGRTESSAIARRPGGEGRPRRRAPCACAALRGAAAGPGGVE